MKSSNYTLHFDKNNNNFIEHSLQTGSAGHPSLPLTAPPSAPAGFVAGRFSSDHIRREIRVQRQFSVMDFVFLLRFLFLQKVEEKNTS